jgi:hypothetical protein
VVHHQATLGLGGDHCTVLLLLNTYRHFVVVVIVVVVVVVVVAVVAVVAVAVAVAVVVVVGYLHRMFSSHFLVAISL